MREHTINMTTASIEQQMGSDMDLNRRGGIRRRIKIEKIEKKDSRQVTFSKRRQGLFKKAAELCVLTGAQLAIIAISPGGKPFTFGHPCVKSVVARCLKSESSGSGWWWDKPIDGLGLEELVSMKQGLENLKIAAMQLQCSSDAQIQ